MLIRCSVQSEQNVYASPCEWCGANRYAGPAEDLGLDFTVDDETFGGLVTQDLLEDGSDIPVTSANKMQYILLMADWHLNGRLGASAGSFAHGMAQACTASCIMSWAALLELML